MRITVGRGWAASVTLVLGLCGLGLGGSGPVPGPGAGGRGGGSGGASAGAQALDAAAKKRFSAALIEGRKLAEQGKNPEAIAVFQRALLADPMGARAMSEMGLCYYRLKQYTEAEAATRRALKATSEPAQRGRSLYNLGLILEARGDLKGAVAAYTESCNARTNQVVLERLRKLDPAAAAALDPVAPRPLQGPFPSLDSVCKALNDCKQRMADEMSHAGPHYTCATRRPLASLVKPGAPYHLVSVFTTTCRHEGDREGYESSVKLVVQGEKGFYVTAVGGSALSAGGGYATEFKLQELRLSDGPPGVQRVWLRFSEDGGRDVGNGSDSWETESLVIAGIGTSGTPSATPPLLLRSREEEDPGALSEDEKATVSVNAKLKPTLRGDELELVAQSPARAITKANLAAPGKHLLLFP